MGSENNVEITLRTTAQGSGAKDVAQDLKEVKKSAEEVAPASEEAAKGSGNLSGSFRDTGKSVRASLLIMRSFKLFMEGDFTGAVRGASIALKGLSFAAASSGIGIALIAATALIGVLMKLKSASDDAADAAGKQGTASDTLADKMARERSALIDVQKETYNLKEARSQDEEEIKNRVAEMDHELTKLGQLREAEKNLALAQIAHDEATGKLTKKQADEKRGIVDQKDAAAKQADVEKEYEAKIVAENQRASAAMARQFQARNAAQIAQKELARKQSEDAALAKEQDQLQRQVELAKNKIIPGVQGNAEDYPAWVEADKNREKNEDRLAQIDARRKVLGGDKGVIAQRQEEASKQEGDARRASSDRTKEEKESAENIERLKHDREIDRQKFKAQQDASGLHNETKQEEDKKQEKEQHDKFVKDAERGREQMIREESKPDEDSAKQRRKADADRNKSDAEFRKLKPEESGIANDAHKLAQRAGEMGHQIDQAAAQAGNEQHPTQPALESLLGKMEAFWGKFSDKHAPKAQEAAQIIQRIKKLEDEVQSQTNKLASIEGGAGASN